MIKLACNSLIAVGEGQWMDAEEFVEFAYQLRLDSVDFQIDRGLRSRDRDYLLRLKRACLRRGLPIGFLGVGSGFVGSTTLPGVGVVGAPLPQDELRRRIDEVKAVVDDAAYIGAPCVRVFGGSIPEATEASDSLWFEMIASYQEVADYAADRGVFIGLHNHPPVDSPTGDDIVRILQDTDRANLTFILDTGRWKGSPGTPPMGVTDPDADIYEYMKQTAPYATYVRAKIYKIDSGREEWIDYDRVMEILTAVGFNGTMSIVYEDQGNVCSPREAITLAVAHLREVIASGMQPRRDNA
jgi:sugar phosphate isomerase/epimerase